LSLRELLPYVLNHKGLISVICSNHYEYENNPQACHPGIARRDGPHPDGESFAVHQTGTAAGADD
jgi:hypothetical protein